MKKRETAAGKESRGLEVKVFSSGGLQLSGRCAAPLPTLAGKDKRPLVGDSSDLRPIWLTTLDTLRNFLLLPPGEILGVMQMLPAAV